MRRGENEGKRRTGSKEVGEQEERGQTPVVDTGSLSWATSQPWTDNKVILSQNEACRFIEQVLPFPSKPGQSGLCHLPDPLEPE